MREVQQDSYLQIVQLTLDTPTYSHNSYLIQCQSNVQMVLLYIVASIRKHTWMIINQLKYICHNKYEILSNENVLSTHKLCNQPFSTLSSRLVCWLSSIFFSSMQQKKNWKLILHSIIKLYVHRKIKEYIHLMHIVVWMALSVMQLCSLVWPSMCTLFRHPY